jgi:hypothetical protein
MEDNIIIRRILVVAVRFPVAGMGMDFNTARCVSLESTY